MSGLSRPANSEGAGAGKTTGSVGMGWLHLNLDRNMSPATPTCNYAVQFLEPTRRWRGADAQGAGVRFHNRHWTTAYAASKHVPMPFKSNPAAAGVTYPELEGGTRGLMRGVLTGA